MATCIVSTIYTYSLLGFYTASAPKERHCPAHNEECDEEMNTESIAKLNQAGEGKTKTKDIKGIDVMHVGGPEALNHN